MKTSIIIPTYNNEEFTIRCVDSIRKNTKDYIILWIDDGSSTESVEKVQRFLDKKAIPYELIAKDKNTGFAKSVNLGLTRALELDSEYIVVQNNDTEVYADWLLRMINVAKRDPRIGAVGPVTSPCASWQAIDNLKTAFNQFSDLPEYHENPQEYAQLISAQYEQEHQLVHKRLAFFSVLLKADLIRETGMLSEEYGIGFGEDDDYMLRLRKKGYFGAIAKDVFVFHNHNTTFKEKYSALEIQKMREQNREILFRKFQKGRFRPEDLDQLWDIEEAITYAKQLKFQIQHKEEQLKDKNRQIQEKNNQLKDKNRQIQEKNNQLKDKNRQIQEKNDQLKDKNRQIQKKNDLLKKKAKKISSITSKLQDTQQLFQQVQENEKWCSKELSRCKTELEAVYNSTSWRITALIRNLGTLIKKIRAKI